MGVRPAVFIVALVVVVCFLSISSSLVINNIYYQKQQMFGSREEEVAVLPSAALVVQSSKSPEEMIVAIHRRNRSAGKTNKNKRLEFVHIPKTGGTAIESEAARMNVSWSVCHFLGTKLSTFISNNHTTCPDAPSTKYKKPTVIHGTPHWHLPPRYFEMKDRYTYNPYENATLFTVVRNPYERLISHYFYANGELANQNSAVLNDPKRLNVWISSRLKKLIHAKQGEIGNSPDKTARLGEAAYYMGNGHLIPQYDYVYDGGETRMIDHVLHFETLHEEFPKLMKEYGLDFIKLPAKQEGKGRISKKQIGLGNLTLENIRLIERVYGRDFAAFGYKALSHRIENQYA